MFLFPRICPVCTREIEGGNHVHCPACEDADDIHTALVDLKRDIDQLKGEHVAYVNSTYPTAADPEVKPLFIPLNTEYFEQFKCRKKLSEIRMYGPRWNETTCAIGRPVVLSKGYGKSDRLDGTIESFTRIRGYKLKRADREAALKLFGNINVDYACIGIWIPRTGNGDAQ